MLGFPDRTWSVMNKLLSLQALLLVSTLPAYAAPEIPPVPGPGEFLQDYAGVINPPHDESIGKLQKIAYEQHDTPIVVVTIDSMGKYDPGGPSIERFAHGWFNKWEIGKRGPEGELINKGILLIVSVGDRKSRIELGAEWGRAQDAHCRKITRSFMIPRFKKSDYSGGIHAGVVELSKLAQMSAEGEGLPAIESESRDDLMRDAFRLSLGKDFVKNKQARTILGLIMTFLVPILFIVAAILDGYFKRRFSAICKIAGGCLFALAMVLEGVPFYGVCFPMALVSHSLLAKKWYLWWIGVVGGFICLFQFLDDKGAAAIWAVLTLVFVGLPWTCFYVIRLVGLGWFWLTNEKVALRLMIPLYQKEGDFAEGKGFLESGGGGGFSSGGFSGGGGASGSW